MDHLDIHHPPAATEDDWQARCGVQKSVQTDRYGCGVACLAMVTGWTYSTSSGAFRKPGAWQKEAWPTALLYEFGRDEDGGGHGRTSDSDSPVAGMGRSSRPGDSQIARHTSRRKGTMALGGGVSTPRV